MHVDLDNSMLKPVNSRVKDCGKYKNEQCNRNSTARFIVNIDISCFKEKKLQVIRRKIDYIFKNIK